MSAAARYAEGLLERVAVVSDRTIQIATIRNELAQIPSSSVLELLTWITFKVEENDARYRHLLWLVCIALADPEVSELKETLRDYALEHGPPFLASLLHDTTSDPSQAHATPELARTPRERPLTLGERKALARKRNRALIRRALRDTDPSVIRIALGNPSLTEEDVVQLCAQRPVNPNVLREVFVATRWAARYRVQRSVVLNPFAPLDVSVPLAAQLPAQDLREIVDSPDLRPELREACSRRLARGTYH